MKRKLAVLAIAGAMVFSVTACGGNNTATENDGGSGSAASSASETEGATSGGSDMMMNTDPVEGQIGSFNGGGTDETTVGGNDYAYDAAIYVEEGAIVEDKSEVDRVVGDFNATGADGIVIDDSESGHNGIIVINSDYTISDATLTFNTEADGSDTCDFSGKGSAIAAYSANVTIEDSIIETTGVATMPIFADSATGARIQWIKHCC